MHNEKLGDIEMVSALRAQQSLTTSKNEIGTSFGVNKAKLCLLRKKYQDFSIKKMEKRNFFEVMSLQSAPLRPLKSCFQHEISFFLFLNN